jgi:exonuclease III
LAATPCQIACLQETKLWSIDNDLAAFLGAYKLTSFAFKPATGTRGGILLLWNDLDIEMNDVRIGQYSLTAEVTIRHCISTFILTVVYGPSRRAEKNAFLQHMRSLKLEGDTKWLILGDFNFIYKARDKNNRNLNIRLMRSFLRAIEFCELKELSLQNRKYTWSNERRRPTLVRLDRAFCNQPWDLAFDSCTLDALSSSHSDHCLLLLTNHAGHRRSTPFKFENF